MKKFYRNLALLLLAAAAAAFPSRAQTSGPVVFFTDLLSGPNTGGENNNGVILTIGGNNFGSTQGNSTVTIGGGAVATYKTWTNTRIQVAIGAAAKTGTVVVTVNGTPSLCANHDDGANCGFSVRSGNIYYVATNGSDSAAGSFTAPWQTILHARSTIKAGDTVYFENGVSQLADDGTGNRSAVYWGGASGTASAPTSLVAYPGATVTIGTYGETPNLGLRVYGSYLNFSGLTFQSDTGLYVNGSTFRVVNNNFHCYDPSNQIQGCFTAAQADHVYVYGNNVHDITQNGSASSDSGKEGHAIYFTTDTNHDWAGWNTLHNNNTCYDIQAHSSPLTGTTGQDQYDIHIHDNSIDTDDCAAINLATVDPSKGTVEVYNNVIWNTGLEGNPGFPDFASWNTGCIYAAGILNAGSAGSGTVQIYNNTLYNCGNNSVTYPAKAAIIAVAGSEPNVHYQLTNNIMVQSGTLSYLAGDLGQFSCSSGKNDFYGAGGVPSNCGSGNLSSNPNFISTSTPNFNLQSGSPALGAGSASVVPLFDFAGNIRANPPAIGAFDVSGTIVSVTQPAAPTNLTVVVQ